MIGIKAKQNSIRNLAKKAAGIFIKKDTFRDKSKRMFRNIGNVSMATLLTLAAGIALERSANFAIDQAVDINLDCIAYKLKLRDNCEGGYKYNINYNTFNQKISAGLARDKSKEKPLESLLVDRIILKDKSLHEKTPAERDLAFNEALKIEKAINAETNRKPIYINGVKLWNLMDYYTHQINFSEKETKILFKSMQNSTNAAEIKKELEFHKNIKIELTAKLLYMQTYDHIIDKIYQRNDVENYLHPTKKPAKESEPRAR